MAISQYPLSLSGSGGVTPFDAPFQYNFPSEQTGSEVVLDLTNTIGSGTYTFSGKANGRQVPTFIELKDSSGTSVGSGSLSTSQGTWGEVNTGTYTGNITATAGFSKIIFKGTNGGVVQFSSSAPTAPSYHVTISAGTRNSSTSDFIGKLATGNNVIIKTDGPTSLPAGQYKIGGAEWYFNNKYYQMTQSITGNPTGSTNTIRVLEWDFSTQSWTTITSANPSTIGMNSSATFYSSSYHNRVFVFKNGTVIIYNHYMFNTNGSGTATYAIRAWRFDGSSLSSVTPNSSNNFFLGSSSYNAVNDEWIHFPFGGWGWSNPNEISRLTNSGGVSRMYMSSRTSNSSNGTGLVQNSATPKIIFAGMLGSYYGADYISSWSADGGLTGSSYTTNSTSPHWYGFGSNFLNNPYTTYIGTFNGVSNCYIGVEANDDIKIIVGPHPIASATSASYSLIFTFDTTSYTGPNRTLLGSNYHAQIQPINSTEIGLFLRPKNDYISGNLYAIPFPSTVSL